MMIAGLERAEELKRAADTAWHKIACNPDRLHELADADLTAIVDHVGACVPFCESLLVQMCGSIDAANVHLAAVGALKRPRLIALVRKATRAEAGRRTPRQMAALLYDFQVGAKFCEIEIERRATQRASRMN